MFFFELLIVSICVETEVHACGCRAPNSSLFFPFWKRKTWLATRAIIQSFRMEAVRYFFRLNYHYIKKIRGSRMRAVTAATKPRRSIPLRHGHGAGEVVDPVATWTWAGEGDRTERSSAHNQDDDKGMCDCPCLLPFLSNCHGVGTVTFASNGCGLLLDKFV